jgi:hypothetical protein
MDAEGAVMDVEQVESGSGEVEQQGSETQHEGAGGAAEYDPFESKAARELSQWLKGIRDADPSNAKHARALKDIFGQQFAFKKEFQGGLDEARGIKALVDSVIHQGADGQELKGAEAIAALQDSVREYAEIDELLARGDPKALESLGEDFNEGLAKLAPAILDRIAQSDPDAYAAAVLPHFVKALAGSELVSNFNGMVDVLNETAPNWLTEAQKTAWAADQQRKVVALAGNMGKWLNAQAAKAGELPKSAGRQNGSGKPPVDREAQQTQREQDYHWNTNISPKLDSHAAQSFAQLFAPYAKRLHLDAPTTNALKMEFSKRVAGQAAKDQAYMGQLKRYRGMRNPDPGTVLNFAKVNFDKHAKTVMDALVNERYKPFLSGKPRTVAPGGNGSKSAAPPAPGWRVSTVRPADSEIDFKHADFVNLRHLNKYPLKKGGGVIVRP